MNITKQTDNTFLVSIREEDDPSLFNEGMVKPDIQDWLCQFTPLDKMYGLWMFFGDGRLDLSFHPCGDSYITNLPYAHAVWLGFMKYVEANYPEITIESY